MVITNASNWQQAHTDHYTHYYAGSAAQLAVCLDPDIWRQLWCLCQCTLNLYARGIQCRHRQSHGL
jgi:hypothetical protein